MGDGLGSRLVVMGGVCMAVTMAVTVRVAVAGVRVAVTMAMGMAMTACSGVRFEGRQRDVGSFGKAAETLYRGQIGRRVVGGAGFWRHARIVQQVHQPRLDGGHGDAEEVDSRRRRRRGGICTGDGGGWLVSSLLCPGPLKHGEVVE